MSSVTYKIDRIPETPYRVNQGCFPVVKYPKNRTTPKVVLQSAEANSGTDMVNPSHGVGRPRNKLIIARTILSKVVKSYYQGSTEDVSKVISLLWNTKNEKFDEYFEYLSLVEEKWHEACFPTYLYQPKTKSNITGERKYSPMETALGDSNGNIDPHLMACGVKETGTLPVDQRIGKKGPIMQTSSSYSKLCSTSYEKIDTNFNNSVAQNFDIKLVQKFRATKTPHATRKKKDIQKKKRMLNHSTSRISEIISFNGLTSSLSYRDKIEDICLDPPTT